jgi:hypothetical protein
MSSFCRVLLTFPGESVAEVSVGTEDGHHLTVKQHLRLKCTDRSLGSCSSLLGSVGRFSWNRPGSLQPLLTGLTKHMKQSFTQLMTALGGQSCPV